MASIEGEPGAFYGPSGFKEMDGQPGFVAPDGVSLDSAIGQALWTCVDNAVAQA